VVELLYFFEFGDYLEKAFLGFGGDLELHIEELAHTASCIFMEFFGVTVAFLEDLAVVEGEALTSQQQFFGFLRQHDGKGQFFGGRLGGFLLVNAPLVHLALSVQLVFLLQKVRFQLVVLFLLHLQLLDRLHQLQFVQTFVLGQSIDFFAEDFGIASQRVPS
jgi:hypothetical protein